MINIENGEAPCLRHLKTACRNCHMSCDERTVYAVCAYWGSKILKCIYLEYQVITIFVQLDFKY